MMLLSILVMISSSDNDKQVVVLSRITRKFSVKTLTNRTYFILICYTLLSQDLIFRCDTSVYLLDKLIVNVFYLGFGREL